ncbi:MAG: isoprenylcysteine carboxylmethyltransferase family protein, partial [Clostridia bacterium]|nr:isoprenylcysteine carboxylmethyltransferase family protein [Clostridia bacterium]
MTKELLIQALLKVFAGIVLMAALLFLPAGTMDYPQGWRLLLLLFIPMILAGFVMMAKCPDLLRKRLNMKEKLGDQKQVVLLSGVMFIAGFAVSGLSFRFGWLMLPDWVSVAACAVFLLSYLMYAEVMR